MWDCESRETVTLGRVSPWLDLCIITRLSKMSILYVFSTYLLLGTSANVCLGLSNRVVPISLRHHWRSIPGKIRLPSFYRNHLGYASIFVVSRREYWLIYRDVRPSISACRTLVCPHSPSKYLVTEIHRGSWHLPNIDMRRMDVCYIDR